MKIPPAIASIGLAVALCLAAVTGESLGDEATPTPEARANRPKTGEVGLLAINPPDITAAIQAEKEARRTPGLSVGIVAGEKLIFRRGIGRLNDDGDRVQLDSLFQIGSLTKTFTATLLCALRDKGVVDLDDPVADYVTGTTLPTDPGGAPAMTLRHLVTHTSGLPTNPINRRDLPNSPSVMLPYSNDELLQGLRRTQLETPAGQAVRYSNLGFGLLGYALERATDQDFDALVQEHITTPLQMPNTRVQLLEEDEPRFAAHYWPGAPDKSQPRWRFGEVSAFGGLISNVPDLARYLSFQMGTLTAPGAPLAQATLREMRTPQRIVDPQWNRGIGLAWFVEPTEDQGPLVYHGGELDGHSSFVGFLPDHGVGVIVLANQGGNAADAVGKAMVKEVLAAVRAELDTMGSFLDAGEWEAALPLVRALSKRNPQSGRSAFRLASVLLELDRPEEAQAAFQTAHRLGFNRPESEFNIARCLARQGKGDAAIAKLQEAYGRGFRDGRLALTMADFDRLHGDARFDELMANRFPGTGQLFLRVISDGAAVALESLRTGETAQVGEAAINQLGYQLLFRDRVEDAIQVFLYNVDAYPRSWNVYDSLGEAYMNASQKELAIANYRRSIELNPRNNNGKRILQELEGAPEGTP